MHPISHEQALLYRKISEIEETTDIKKAAQLLAEGPWVVISIALGENDSVLFSLGRIDFSR